MTNPKHKQSDGSVFGAAQALLQARLVDLDKLADRLPKPEMLEVSEELYSIAAHAALIGTYLDAREKGRSHEQAKKAANATRRIVRKRFGYHTTLDINF